MGDAWVHREAFWATIAGAIRWVTEQVRRTNLLFPSRLNVAHSSFRRLGWVCRCASCREQFRCVGVLGRHHCLVCSRWAFGIWQTYTPDLLRCRHFLFHSTALPCFLFHREDTVGCLRYISTVSLPHFVAEPPSAACSLRRKHCRALTCRCITTPAAWKTGWVGDGTRNNTPPFASEQAAWRGCCFCMICHSPLS